MDLDDVAVLQLPEVADLATDAKVQFLVGRDGALLDHFQCYLWLRGEREKMSE